MLSATVQTMSSILLRRLSEQMNGSPTSGPVLRTVADRPALLRVVARQHTERRPERRDGSRCAAVSSASSTRVVEVRQLEQHRLPRTASLQSSGGRRRRGGLHVVVGGTDLRDSWQVPERLCIV